MRRIAWPSRWLSLFPLLLCLIGTGFSAAQLQPTEPSPLPVAPSQTVPRTSPIRIAGYHIDVVFDPAHHSLKAQTTVNFTALRPLTVVSLQLNPALGVTSITDAAGNVLNAQRVSTNELGYVAANTAPSDSSIEVAPAAPLQSGRTATWTFTYGGIFEPGTNSNSSPSAGQLASIGDPVSYLLYAAQWFPIAGSMTTRFAATIHVHVPAGERVFGSGLVGSPHPDKNGDMVFDFAWTRSGFPGTIVAGKFAGPFTAAANPILHVYLAGTNANSATTAVAQRIAALAARQYSFFTAQFGPLPSSLISGGLNIVELSDDSPAAYSAPQLAAISGSYLRGENSSRLLANTIAHQWWGEEVSPATRNDRWITNGMCRYAELAFLQTTAPKAAYLDAVFNVSASALAYDTIPLADAARYAPFSPQFQAMTYDKGGMIFRMLQWQIGDTAFHQTLRDVTSQAAKKSISAAELESIAEKASQQNLQPFFTQWMHSTGAPDLQDQWTLYRLGDNRGFRTVGEIHQDLDLFQMPVDIRVETKNKTLDQRVDVSGSSSQFVIHTAEIPHNISLDPNRRLLRNSPAMQVRVHILRGQQMAAQGNSSGAIQEYREALAIDSINSLTSYRLGDVYFRQRNYQAAADAYRAALDGDGLPKWTEVWSDLQLGKIFDASGERDRAVNQYREALQTGDNTGNALDLARQYLQHAYNPK